MTDDLATLIKIIVVAASLYILLRSFGGTKEDQEEFKENFAFGTGCIVVPISLIIFIAGLVLMFNGLIGIGFILLCISGLINWGTESFMEWLDPDDR